MDFGTVLSAIALWCGQSNSAYDSIEKCRRQALKCVEYSWLDEKLSQQAKEKEVAQCFRLID